MELRANPWIPLYFPFIYYLFVDISALKCGVYSRVAFNRINKVAVFLRKRYGISFAKENSLLQQDGVHDLGSAKVSLTAIHCAFPDALPVIMSRIFDLACFCLRPVLTLLFQNQCTIKELPFSCF